MLLQHHSISSRTSLGTKCSYNDWASTREFYLKPAHPHAVRARLPVQKILRAVSYTAESQIVTFCCTLAYVARRIATGPDYGETGIFHFYNIRAALAMYEARDRAAIPTAGHETRIRLCLQLTLSQSTVKAAYNALHQEFMLTQCPSRLLRFYPWASP